MNRVFVIIIITIVIISECNDNSNKSDNKTGKHKKDSIHAATKQRSAIKDTTLRISENTTDVLKNILGTWILKGSENPTFDIKKSTIFYPEHFKSYKYEIVKDSIIVKYNDFDESFLFKFKGIDTLILVGDDGQQIYYRVKK